MLIVLICIFPGSLYAVPVVLTSFSKPQYEWSLHFVALIRLPKYQVKAVLLK
jgi:hypothetical protein